MKEGAPVGIDTEKTPVLQQNQSYAITVDINNDKAPAIQHRQPHSITVDNNTDKTPATQQSQPNSITQYRIIRKSQQQHVMHMGYLALGQDELKCFKFCLTNTDHM